MITGLLGKHPRAFWSEDVWTLTMPVLPPLVVTRMDCESRIHTVLSSCLGSVDLTGSVETALAGVVIDEEFGIPPCGVLASGLQTCIPLNPAVFRAPCCSLGETEGEGVLTVLASFRGATC